MTSAESQPKPVRTSTKIVAYIGELLGNPAEHPDIPLATEGIVVEHHPAGLRGDDFRAFAIPGDSRSISALTHAVSQASRFIVGTEDTGFERVVIDDEPVSVMPRPTLARFVTENRGRSNVVEAVRLVSLVLEYSRPAEITQ